MKYQKIFQDIVSAFIKNTNYGLVPDSLDGKSYPLDLEFTLKSETKYYAPKDLEGIPLYKYQSIGVQYLPTRIAAYALAQFNRHVKTGEERSLGMFFQMAEWFMRPSDAIWLYQFDVEDLKAPWISCMAQGEGISVLTRAYLLSGDSRYLNQAKKAASIFKVPIECGGVRSLIENQYSFLEEYPSKMYPKHTLNGFLYAVIGILDLIDLYPDSQLKLLLSELVNTVASKWKLWDLSYWSAYDLHKSKKGRRNFATVSYHNLHITQISYLAYKLNNQSLYACAERWVTYYHSPFNRLRALFSKMQYRAEERGYQ